MIRKLLLSAALALLPSVAFAQATISVANDGTTGTKIGNLAKYTTANPETAILTATTDTTGVIGIVTGWVNPSGTTATATTGNAIIARLGQPNCQFDASGVTSGDWVINSTLTAGRCADSGTAGTSARPTGKDVVGIATASGIANAFVPVDMQLSYLNTSGSGSPGGSSNAIQYNNGGAFGGIGPLTNGQIVIGSTGSAPVAGTITAGTNVTVTNSAGGITIAASGGGSGCSTSGSSGNALADNGSGGCTSESRANFSGTGGGTLTMGLAGTSAGNLALANATSGSITLAPATGALGASFATLPVNTGAQASDVISEINLAETRTATMTFSGANLAMGTNSITGNFTATGVPIFTGLSAGTIASGKNLGLDASNNLVTATVSGGGVTCPTGFTNTNNPTGECVLTKNQSAQSSISFTGLANDNYTLRCSGIVPATTSVGIGIQVAPGGTFDTTSGHYIWGLQSVNDIGTTGSDSGAGSGPTTAIEFQNLNASNTESTTLVAEFTGLSQTVTHDVLYHSTKSDGSHTNYNMGGGTFTANTTAITGVRIIATSGNITANCTLTVHAI